MAIELHKDKLPKLSLTEPLTMHPEDHNKPSGDGVLYIVAAMMLAPGFLTLAYCLLNGYW